MIIVCMCRIDKELKDIESKQHIHSRWSPSDRAYVEVKSMFTKERIYQVAEAMWAASSRRLFLLQLKAKYAGNYHVPCCCTCTVECVVSAYSIIYSVR